MFESQKASKLKSGRTKEVVGHQLDRMVAQVVLPHQVSYEKDVPSPSKAWVVPPSDLAFSAYQGVDKLRVLVIGAGFAGLAAAISCARQGFSVTVLERSSGLSPHGDAITIGANAAKILYRWGIGPELWDRSAQGAYWLFKDAHGHALSDENLTQFPTRFGAPVLVRLEWPRPGSRTESAAPLSYSTATGLNFWDLLESRLASLGSLGVEARFLGVHVRLDTEVVEYYDTPSYPAVVTRDEEIIEADVILIADGVNSISRALLAPRSAENLRERKVPSEYSIHRAAMKSDLIKADPLTAHLLDGCTRTWIGKDAHAIITPLDDGRQIAFSLTHRETIGKASLNWRDKKPIKDALSHVQGWDPVLTRAISLFPHSLNWSLPNEKPAPDWVSGGGAICFLGDSCHPMISTTFQGGSMAIEDGATVAIALGLTGKRPADVRLALRVFQDLRRDRVANVTAMGVEQRQNWHSYHCTKDPAMLSLLTLRYYSFDAELFALTNFEATASKFDSSFSLSDVAFDDVLRVTGIEDKSSVPREGKMFKRTSKPRQ